MVSSATEQCGPSAATEVERHQHRVRADASECRDADRPAGNRPGITPSIRARRNGGSQRTGSRYELTLVEREALASTDAGAIKSFANALDRRIRRADV